MVLIANINDFFCWHLVFQIATIIFLIIEKTTIATRTFKLGLKFHFDGWGWWFTIGFIRSCHGGALLRLYDYYLINIQTKINGAKVNLFTFPALSFREVINFQIRFRTEVIVLLNYLELFQFRSEYQDRCWFIHRILFCLCFSGSFPYRKVMLVYL